MNISQNLQSLGLSPTEASVYLDLLEYGTQTISSIARTSKLHRPMIYKAIPSLKEKGLIAERQVGKLIHYSAESPAQLHALLDARHSELNHLIPQLKKMRDTRRPHVRRLDHKVGIHAVFEDILNTLKKGDEFYRYSSEDKHDIESVGLPKDYRKRRDAMKLERLVITNPEFIAGREPKLDVSMKVVPKEFFPFDYGVAQIIYGDKIAFIDYGQEVATIIENPTIAKMQKDIFKMLFKKL